MLFDAWGSSDSSCLSRWKNAETGAFALMVEGIARPEKAIQRRTVKRTEEPKR